MYHIPYNKNLKDFSRVLRNNSTLAEVLLWEKLKGGQFMDYKFNRQKPLNHYIVDFYCKTLNLVIEIDGNSHDTDYAKLNDIERQQILEAMGMKFIRFGDIEVKRNMLGVLKAIENFILEISPTN